MQLKALFPNTENRLYPNQSVRVSLKTRVLNNAVVIPQRGVQLSDAGSYVWKLYREEKDGNRVTKVAKVNIQTGVDYQNKVVVTQGLQAGDRFVVLGSDHLRDGSKIQVGETPSEQPPVTQADSTQTEQ